MKNTNFTEITSRLLKIEDVQNIQTPTPFFDILSKNQNDLWLLGTQHTHDQNNFQIPILEKWFTDFLQKKYRNPILCLEGFIPNETLDEEKIVQKYGEQGILIVMAQKNGIPIQSIEPTQTEVSDWAVQIFNDPTAHAAWAILNVLMRSPKALQKALPSIAKTYHFPQNTSDFLSLISNYLYRQNILHSPKELMELATNLTHKEIFKKAQKPGDGPFPTNIAGSAINIARDYGLFINTIETIETNKYDGVFAWFGLNHVLTMMPAFQKNGFERKEKALLEKQG